MALQGVLELLPLQLLLTPATLQADLGLLRCSYRMVAALLAGAGVAMLPMPQELDMHPAVVEGTDWEVGAGSQAGVVGRLAAGGQGTQAVRLGTGHTQEAARDGHWELRFGDDLAQGLSLEI